MPKLDDLTVKSKSRKFEKVQYRPWEITEQKSTNENPSPSVEVESMLKNIDKETQEKDVSHTPTSEGGDLSSDHEKSLRSLHGVQRGIILFLSSSISHSDAEFSYTKAFSTQDIANHIRTSRASIAASLLRLKQKGFVHSHETKPGRGGFAAYKINKSLAQYIQCFSVSK